jgi:beta-glucanase (GH16 family)
LEVYKPSNVSIVDGALVLEARAESITVGTAHRSYTSGKVTTQGLQSFQYGRLAARIKLPATQAMWPAFWAMGNNGGWPSCGEIDIIEAKGRLPGETSGALHWGTDWAHHVYAWGPNTFPTGTDFTSWHEYAAEWTATYIKLSVDGTVFFTMDTQPTGYFNQPFYLLLNLAVGGTFDGGLIPPSPMAPQRMYVDYVHVYQR